ncbi:uncharacterized protein DUF481 [Pseudomonas duriflava]|uniref:Uncharacterized protein DUF481 n=1 Tax=Pseudomonas duriflava TaxID=459528 RepID=A0A562QP74_9PSED|nr:DUF481 domain-containing protein [Pseudomonas duriflava]TWI58495.1 uncharacterized protein DUF481 [Pseudomonas duriflava]
MLSRTLFYVAAASLVAGAAHADTVWLKNGDRLTGTIKLLDSKKLLLQTEYGGSIPLDWSKISTLQSDNPVLVRRGDYADDVEVKRLKPAGQGEVIVDTDSQGEQTMPLASITQIVPPRPFLRDFTWKGNVDVALDYKRAEEDTDDYDVDFKTQARHGMWRHNGQGSYNKEKSDGEVSTDNWSLEYALDRFINEQFFWQGRVSYDRDKIEDIARQRTIGTGPGYQFWDNELGAFSLTALLDRADYKYQDGTQDNFYSVSMKWNYNRYFSGKTFELFTMGEIGRPLDNTADFSLDSDIGLRYKVTNWASLNLKASKQWVSGAEGHLNETEYSAGFGVTW